MRVFPIALLAVICWCAYPVAGDDFSFPADVEVDVVFPRNDSYVPIEPFPVVFAIQNFELAWRSGFRLKWEIHTGPDNYWPYRDSGTIYVNSPRSNAQAQPPPSTPIEYLVDQPRRAPAIPRSYNTTTWVLRWSLSWVTTCQRLDDGRLRIQSGGTHGSGEVRFTLDPEGRMPEFESRDEDDCPEFGDLLGVSGIINDGCFTTASAAIGQPTPCAASVDASAAQSISNEVGRISVLTTTTTASAAVASTTTAKPASGSPTQGTQHNDDAGGTGQDSPGADSTASRSFISAFVASISFACSVMITL